MAKYPKGSLAREFPEYAKEWHPDNCCSAAEISANSNKKVKWLCKNNHTFESVVKNRIHGVRCPHCKSLFNVYPELAKQWHQNNSISATEIMAGSPSKQKFLWVCAEGHEFESTLPNRLKHYRRNNSWNFCKICKKINN